MCFRVTVMHTEHVKSLLRPFSGKAQERIPFWLMRQAGRYLPEYREVRARAGSFLDLVYNPALAAEVTLQPLRRFGMDGAILFSDILVIPDALGQSVAFTEGEGPKLDPLKDAKDIAKLHPGVIDSKLSSVYETIDRIRAGLNAEGFHDVTLIGFAGAPWTLACYMIEGGSSREFVNVKRRAYADPEGFGALIDVLTESTIHYLLQQIRAGAEAIQIFDSWAGIMDADLFRRWVIQPTKRIVEAIRGEYPAIPVIGFPRGAGQSYISYIQETGVNGVSLDYQVSLKWASGVIQPQTVAQGNLDPVCLLAGGDALVTATESILSALGRGPFIFNLGHGIQKDTPPEHVEMLCDVVRNWVP